MQAKLPLTVGIFSLCTLPLMSGCHRGQTIADAGAALPADNSTPVCIVEISHASSASAGTGHQAAALAELLPWLMLELPRQQVPQTTQAPGPSLVAGDWLAFQCAMAGGYWDIPAHENTPTFAGVTQNGPMPE